MFSYPEYALQLSADRQHELRAAADRHRLLASARWARKRQGRVRRHRNPAPPSDRVGTLAA